MMRTLACVAMLLAAEVAHSAPPTKSPATSMKEGRFRFLSLAEARAIALEQGNRIDLPAPVVLARHQSRSKGILLVAHAENEAELERNVNQILLNVENAYWNLHGSYWQLHSREQGLRMAYEMWKLVGARYRDGHASQADYAQAEGQYNLFRGQRLQTMDTVLDNERQLRAVMGLPIEDGSRLVPSDTPTRTERQPDWEKALHAALRRPELRLAREDMKAARLDYVLTKDLVIPLLRCLGTGPRDCAEGVEVDPFCKRCTGLKRITNAPGYLRESQLRLQRAFLVLQNQEMKAQGFLSLYYRRLSSSQAQIKAASVQREAFATQLRMRSDAYTLGGEGASLDLLLESQRFWADALATECQAVVTYNNAIAGWAYAKGAIMPHAHVKLAEEAPAGEQVRAVERERMRTRAHVRREPGVLANTPMSVPSAASLPALWKCFPPLRDAEPLPVAPEGDVRLVEWSVPDVFARGHKHAH